MSFDRRAMGYPKFSNKIIISLQTINCMTTYNGSTIIQYGCIVLTPNQVYKQT